MALPATLLLVSSLLLRGARWITALLILPFLLLWGLFFSYEIRTASLVFPLIALVIGMVIDRLFGGLMKPLDNMTLGAATIGSLIAVVVVLGFSGWVLTGKPGASLLPAWAIRFESNEWIAEAMEWYSWGLAAFGLIALLSIVITIRNRQLVISWPIPAAGLLVWVAVLSMGKYRADTIVASQRALERRIGTPAVNERLYAIVQARAIHQPIMTDYWFLRSLPDLESLYRALPCGAPCNYDGLKWAAASQPDAGYILMYDSDFDPDTLAKLPSSRGFHTVLTVDGLRLMEINRAAIDAKNQPPQALSVNPASGAGSRGSFRFSYSDPDGTSDISSVIVIINDTSRGIKGCYLQWYRTTNTITIANDNGSGWAEEQKLGSSGAIHNSQCEVDMPGTSMAEADGRLELKLDLRFLLGFHGRKHLYTYVMDDYGASSGYRDLGSWDVN